MLVVVGLVEEEKVDVGVEVEEKVGIVDHSKRKLRMGYSLRILLVEVGSVVVVVVERVVESTLVVVDVDVLRRLVVERIELASLAVVVEHTSFVVLVATR